MHSEQNFSSVLCYVGRVIFTFISRKQYIFIWYSHRSVPFVSVIDRVILQSDSAYCHCESLAQIVTGGIMKYAYYNTNIYL